MLDKISSSLPIQGIGLDELTPNGYESLNGLKKDGQAKGQKEDAIEKCAKELSSCPSEREVLGRFGSLRDL